MTESRRERVRKSGDALLIVDLQNDFCPGGSLAVPGGDEIVPVVNGLMRLFPRRVFATKDWHPANHSSFSAYGGTWPPHCVQKTNGSAFHPNLNHRGVTLVFYKAYESHMDVYSGFEGVALALPNDTRETQVLRRVGVPLLDVLGRADIQRIFIVGLATDYCVKATVLDGVKYGFNMIVVSDGIRAVNVNPEDGENAIREMKRAGARFVESRDLVS